MVVGYILQRIALWASGKKQLSHFFRCGHSFKEHSTVKRSLERRPGALRCSQCVFYGSLCIVVCYLRAVFCSVGSFIRLHLSAQQNQQNQQDGGDGTFRGAQALSKFGVNVIGIPATIDNDIGCTNYCLGFDTAANTAIECIDKLRDTMQAHERCSVVEVMGRHAGFLAMYVGLAVGATAVLVPENPTSTEELVEKIRKARLGGFSHFMVVVAEGASPAHKVAEAIKEATDLDPRVTVLGHIQRGGDPTARDRVAATKMGYLAVELLKQDLTNRIVCTHEGGFTHVDMDEGLATTKSMQVMEMDVLDAMTGL